MKLKNYLLVVENIEASKAFYHELFGLEVVADFGSNVVLTGRLVLQERKPWETSLEKKVTCGGHDAELYFEENQMDLLLERLESSAVPVEYVTTIEERDWGQRMIRIYDPDRHVIEIAETEESVARRLKESGMTLEEVSEKMHLPLDVIQRMTE